MLSQAEGHLLYKECYLLYTDYKLMNNMGFTFLWSQWPKKPNKKQLYIYKTNQLTSIRLSPGPFKISRCKMERVRELTDGV